MAGLSIALEGISKSFGAEKVLKDVDLSVGQGELISLLGPSGCGKSTLLRIIAGLDRADAGSIRLGDEHVDALPAGARDVAMVFQSYALYPHMSVADNIGLSLEMTGLSTLQRLPLIGPLMPGARAARRAVAARVNRAAELTEIAHLLARRPAQLSGGQRQRVALARAMAREPGIFLMDEPLSNLDAKLRVAMRSEIADLNKRLGATFLFVTHDQSDAMAMSDRIALMLGGRIRQIGAPQEIYDAPVHIEVATFIGQPAINLLQAEIDASGRIGFAGSRHPFAVSALPAGRAMLGIRAECFEPAAAIAPGALFALAVRLDRVERMGAETLLRCRIPSVEKPVICRLTTDRFDALTATGLFSHEFQLSARARGTHLFGPDGAVETFRPLVKVGLEAAQ